MEDYYSENNNGGGFNTTDDDSKKGRISTVIPVTVKQISMAEQVESTFRIDGSAVHRVKLIAQIMSKSKQTNTVNLELDDGTGRIDTRYWLQLASDDEENQEDETAGWLEGLYVRVFGHLRKFKDSEKTSFVALSVKPIVDYNEITFHLLEAIHVHLLHLKAPASSSDPMMVSNTYQGTSTGASAGAYAAQTTEAAFELSALHGTVLEVIKGASASSSDGASISFVLEQMSAYDVTQEDVLAGVQFLKDEGIIYPTIDEQHFST